jgi:hypothetical protein
MHGRTPKDWEVNIEVNRKFLNRQRAELNKQRLLCNYDIAYYVRRTEALIKASNALLTRDEPPRA